LAYLLVVVVWSLLIPPVWTALARLFKLV
jgi:hypothetical protein